jgi:shikimate kinase
VVLIGPRGAGKSTLAPRLAQALGWRCIDLDQEIAHQTQTELSEWINSHGWSAFRALERAALANASTQNKVVIACGAGLVEDVDNQANLRKASHVVLWLDIDPKEQERRLREDALRPRLEPKHSWIEELQIVDQRRRILYQELSDQRLDAAVKPDQLLSNCLGFIQQHQN